MILFILACTKHMIKAWMGSKFEIIIIFAGYKDNYKSLNEFEFLSDPITNY